MILVASDKFKDTYSAQEINELITRRVGEMYPGEEVMNLPMADGGEGTAAALAVRNGLERKTVGGYNPLGGKCTFEFYAGHDVVAVDSAAVVGLATFSPEIKLVPLIADTFQLGRLVDSFLREGVRKIYLGIGGTMTVDGGVGLLCGLGFKFFTGSGRPLFPIPPARLGEIGRVIPPDRDFSPLTALSDVDVPLVAPSGLLSSLSFAAQKGVKPNEIPLLGAALAKYQQVTSHLSSTPHYNGAGGGLGYAVSLLPGAELTSGAEFLLGDTISRLRPDRIFTGEGCFDEQSLGGKVTGTIISQAAELNIPVTVVCGRCTLRQLPPNVSVILLKDFMA